jgi:hypothetical protein
MRFHRRGLTGMLALVVPVAIAVACGSSSSGDDDGLQPGSGSDAASDSTSSGGDGSKIGDGATPIDAGWSPANLAGLVLWLDAARGVTENGATVSAWADQSSAKNNASAAPKEPAVVNAGIGGLPAMHFDGGGAYFSITDSASLQWATGDFLIEAVGRCGPPGLGLLEGVYSKDLDFMTPGIRLNVTLSGPDAGVAVAKISEAIFVQGGVSHAFDMTPHRYVARRIGTMLQVSADGAVVGTVDAGATTDTSAIGAPALVGTRALVADAAPSDQFWNGDIAEIVAVKGTTSDADALLLDTYLKQKYGL